MKNSGLQFVLMNSEEQSSKSLPLEGKVARSAG